MASSPLLPRRAAGMRIRSAALAAMALCVCAVLLVTCLVHQQEQHAAELYLSVPLQLSNLETWDHKSQRMVAEGSTMLASASGESSSVLEARQAQVEEDDSAEAAHPDDPNWKQV
jgi:hypothetical protein